MSYQENKLMNLKDGQLLLKTLDGRKADVITETASGEIATFTDGADNMPMKVKAGIDPVQSFNGYNAPWAGGTNKNLFDAEHPSVTYSNGVTYVYNSDGSITLSGTANSSASLFFFTLPNEIPSGTEITWSLNNSDTNSEVGVRLVRRESGGIANWGTAVYADEVNKTNNNITTTFDTNEINVFVKSNHGAVSEITLKIQLELGTTVTDWTPYANICPISGWTQSKITRAGANLVNINNFIGINGETVTITGNSIRVVGNGSQTYQSAAITKTNKTYSAGTYYMKFKITGNSIFPSSAKITLRKFNNNVADEIPLVSGTTEYSKIMTITEDCYLSIMINTTTTGDSYASDITIYDLIVSTMDVPYEPFADHVYTIEFPSEAGTVYGGTLTIYKDGSGTLVVDKAIANASDFTWTYVSNGYLYATVSDIKRATSGVIPDIISNMYVADVPSTVTSSSGKNGTMSIGVSSSRILVRDDRYTTSEAFVESGAYFVYPLDSAEEITFTAQQIRSLLGITNVWADTGDILSVDYPADTKMYIDNLFNSILPATGVSF